MKNAMLFSVLCLALGMNAEEDQSRQVRVRKPMMVSHVPVVNTASSDDFLNITGAAVAQGVRPPLVAASWAIFLLDYGTFFGYGIDFLLGFPILNFSYELNSIAKNLDKNAQQCTRNTSTHFRPLSKSLQRAAFGLSTIATIYVLLNTLSE
ncbi:MAG: hypothetical protein LVQ75_05195 [Candidatus Babeliales bacterium]|jgi:hypothetical protein